MPLNLEPIQLEDSPRSAGVARRHVRDICRRIDREDLIDSAQLGISELVANAVLHGEPPITLRLRGTREHPRIELYDGSTELPVLPPHVDPDNHLTTFGRGLSLVARCSTAWGAVVEPEGKVVWFEPANEMRVDPVPGVMDTLVPEPQDCSEEEMLEIRLLGLDIRLSHELAHQFAELRRELRLLALAHADSYPQAATLSHLLTEFSRVVPDEFRLAVGEGVRLGIAEVDLTVQVRRSGVAIYGTMVDMLDLADAFCRAQRLLTIERSPLQREFHTWLLREIGRQAAGEQPLRWEMPGHFQQTHQVS